MKASSSPTVSRRVVKIAQQLSQAVSQIDFSQHVPWVYNPLDYAWKAHKQYLSMYARPTCEVLFLGMNPGPWGMAQSGVPFGEIAAVKDFLQINAPTTKPALEHPKRPIQGLACARSEVSGRRLWGLFSERFSTADAFFEKHFVTNYCPLVFMEESARNVTPDKLPAECRAQLQSVCDQHLVSLVQALQPQWLVGIGGFAEKCAERIVPECQHDLQIGRILHPSPASPAANRDWAGTAQKQLVDLGIW